MWIIVPFVLAIMATLLSAKKGLKTWCLITCVFFLYAGMFMGYARAASWNDRGGPAGEVVLLGEIEVGCRGEQGDIIDLFRVTDIVQGNVVRRGDSYLLRIPDGVSNPIRWGDILRVRGSLYIFDSEGGGVGGSLSADEIEVIGRNGNPLLRLAVAYRDALRTQVEEELKPDVAGLIDGMVLGDYRLLSARDLMAFRLAGLIHLCAASGLNVGILAVFILWIGRKLRMSRRMITVIQIPLLMTYVCAHPDSNRGGLIGGGGISVG